MRLDVAGYGLKAVKLGDLLVVLCGFTV